tara:strand:- start:3603 stop:5219 length:1617 start_codon:yes stop_codon:yes gene_type:complete
MGKYGKTITDAYQEVLEWTVTAHELQEKKKVTKREIKDLENDNEHGMVALKLAQSFGTPKEVKKIQDINKRHQRAGEIESKDQKERDAIARKYYNMAEVYEIGTKEYDDHTKNMTPGQTVDEGKMKDIVTDVKSALGKIRHRVSQKGSKFIVSVDSNDEEDAQKAMKNHPLYVAGKLRVIPEETELDESKFYLFDNEKDARDYAKKIKGKYVKGTGKSAGQHAVVKEEVELDEVTMATALNIDPKDVDKMKVLAVLYTRALKLPSNSPMQDKIKKEIAKLRKQLGMNEESLIEDAMVIDLDYSKNPKGLYNAVLQMSKRLGLTIYNAPQAMKDLQTKGKVRLGGKGANLVKFMKYLNDKGIEPSVDVQKGKMKEGIVEKIEYVEYKFKNSRDASSAKSYFDGIQLMKFDVNDDNISNGELMVDAGNKDMTKYHKEVMKKFKPKVMVQEKKLTDAEMKKREEIAKAIEKDNPNMPMDKKMAIATATAKRVAEEEEPDKPDTAKQVDQMRDDKKKTRIAQLQLQIAKATETINKLNAQEK